MNGARGYVTAIQVKKDNLRANWQTLEDYLAVKLDCTITSWLKITYKGLKRLLSVFISYLDVTTDLILLGTVWAVLAGTSYVDNEFAYQVAIILLISIVIPLLTSAIMIASSQPFVVMKALAWKKLTKNHTDFEIGFVKSFVMGFFPFVPALIIIGKENAIDKRKSLRDKNYKKEDLVSTSVLKECQLLTDYINECSAAQLTIKRNELIQNKTAKVCNLLSKGNKIGANLTPKISILFFRDRLNPLQMSMRVKTSKNKVRSQAFFFTSFAEIIRYPESKFSLVQSPFLLIETK